ncbi:HAD family hydrolase [Candidatus Woesearchaeota archaeon]|nr:HAD family hydrolase [Candidatus Woesearchaeota archaeon]
MVLEVKQKTIKIISFDLDGTLLDKKGFDSVFWFEEIPRLYAKKKKISIKRAKKFVYGEYNKVGNKRLDWYFPSYWFKHFKLKEDHKIIMKDMKRRIKLFPEVKKVLKKLSKKYKLIVVTTSTHEMNEIKLETEGLKGYFSKVFSVTSDFRMTKKNPDVFLKIIKKLKIKKHEIVHVGDTYEDDYIVPRKAGIKAVLIGRKIRRKGKYIINTLKKLENLINA